MRWIVAILIAVGVFHFYPKWSAKKEVPIDTAGAEVVLYATDWCGYCRKTRDFLASRGVEYTEYNIEKSKQAADEHRALGGRGIPVLLVNGTVIHGYDPEGILEALRKKG